MFKDSLQRHYKKMKIGPSVLLLEMKEEGSERELIIDVALVTLAPADSQKTFSGD